MNEEMKRLQSELKRSAERMTEYRKGGFYEQEAAEHENYNKILSKINELNKKEEKDSTSKKEEKWHPKLTPEQIEELKAENIEVGDNEYIMYLRNHGIDPNDVEVEKEDETDKENSKSSEYNKSLEEYNKMVEIYKEDLETLYELQKQYEKGEIDYEKYEKHADYMVERYRFMQDAYKKMMDLYNKNENKFEKLTNDELEQKLSELNEELTDEWNFRAHQENGMEEHQDNKIDEIQKEIENIKKELKERENNPLRGLSDEELEAKKKELYAKIVNPDDYHFRAHQENGMEGYEEDEIDKALKEIQNEIDRRKKANSKEKPEQIDQPMMILKDKDKIPEPTPPSKPKTNLPLRSGLQVYRDLLNETGYIKGSKAIRYHDWCDKFGIIGKLPAAIIRKVTGRKKEINRMVEILDDMQENNPEDFELLMDDFLLKDNDTVNIMEHKVNEILLMAVEKKCQKDFAEQDKQLEGFERALDSKYNKLNEELEKAQGDKIIEINEQLAAIGETKAKIHARRQKLESRPRRLKEGREDKSLDRKNNIKGKFRANRNPDNRKEINELADIELKALVGKATGDKAKEYKARQEMEEYKDAETEYTYKRNGKVKCSKGAFDAPKGEIKVISHQKYIAPEVLHAVALAVGVTTAQALSFMKQQEQMQNAAQMAQQNMQQKIDSVKSQLSGQDVNAGMDSLNVDANNINLAGERTADFQGGFNTGSQAYKTADHAGLTRTNGAIKDVDSFTPNGNTTLSKLANIFQKKSNLAQNYGESAHNGLAQAATDYYAQHTPATSGGFDHTIASIIEKGVGTSYSSQADLFANISDLLGSLDKLDASSLNALANAGLDLKPLLLTLLPTGVATTKKIIEQDRRKVDTKGKTKPENEEPENEQPENEQPENEQPENGQPENGQSESEQEDEYEELEI